jgi:hypothetical protein
MHEGVGGTRISLDLKKSMPKEGSMPYISSRIE